VTSPNILETSPGESGISSERIIMFSISTYNSSCLYRVLRGGFQDKDFDPYHSKRNSWETMSLKLTVFLDSFSAIFFTPTFD
jgi:hypothetical protein